MKKSSLVMSGIMLLALFTYGNVLAAEATTEADATEAPEVTVPEATAEVDVTEAPATGAPEKEATPAPDVKLTSKSIKSQVVTEDFLQRTRENISVPKEIEVNSVNFIKLKSKPNEIFIPNPKVADVDLLDNTSMYLMGIAPGITSLVAHDQNGNVIADYLVKVTHPISQIRKAVADVYPDLDLQFASVDASLLVKGKVPSPEAAADVMDIVGRFVESGKIINKLSIETATQVMLKVKIAEVSRDLTKNLGIDWRALSIGKGISSMTYGFSGYNTLASGGTLPEFTDLAALRKSLSEEGKIFSSVVGQGEWLVHTNGNSGGLSALIQALATESFASVLAEPTLITLSGKKAVFKSGGEQPYTVRQSGTNDSNTTEFKEWGTSVEFTPVVLSEDRINITVKPIVSTIEYPELGDGTPAVAKKEAETTVELGSGQSLAIAGLLQTNKAATAKETPFLADIPLVGALFRSSQVKRTEKELIIIVTPYIVKPSSKKLRVPTDMVPRMYSPLESIITRKFHKNVKKSRSGIKLSAGYSLR